MQIKITRDVFDVLAGQLFDDAHEKSDYFGLKEFLAGPGYDHAPPGWKLAFVARDRAKFIDKSGGIWKAVEGNEFMWLRERVRYDQKLALALFESLTGIKVKGMSNKALGQLFDKLEGK